MVGRAVIHQQLQRATPIMSIQFARDIQVDEGEYLYNSRTVVWVAAIACSVWGCMASPKDKEANQGPCQDASKETSRLCQVRVKLQVLLQESGTNLLNVLNRASMPLPDHPSISWKL